MIAENTIHLLDCLEGIKQMRDKSVSAIITDPPYCIGTTSNGTKGSWSDNNLIAPFFNELFREMQRVLKDGGYVYINTDWRTYPFLYPLLYKYFDIRNCIVWDYEWIKAGTFYRFSQELIIFCTKGEAKRRFSASERDVWRIKPMNFTDGSKQHNAQKPIELVRKMVKDSTEEGDLVLDCFMGSGTTAVACKELKRRFIGFEIDENVWNIAIKRLENVMAQTTLSDVPSKTDEDKSSGAKALRTPPTTEVVGIRAGDFL